MEGLTGTEAFAESSSDAQYALQFTRSRAGITATVMGVREPEPDSSEWRIAD